MVFVKRNVAFELTKTVRAEPVEGLRNASTGSARTDCCCNSSSLVSMLITDFLRLSSSGRWRLNNQHRSGLSKPVLSLSRGTAQRFWLSTRSRQAKLCENGSSSSFKSVSVTSHELCPQTMARPGCRTLKASQAQEGRSVPDCPNQLRTQNSRGPRQCAARL